MKKKIATLLALIFWLGGLAQCGDSNALSKNVKFTLVPDDPIVVNSDLTLNAGLANEIVIKAPWFLFKTRIENKSTNRVYIVTVSFKGTGTNNGGTVDVETALDPGIACAGSGRSYLAILDAGQIYASVTNSCNPSTATSAIPYEGWYISGLPETDTGSYALDVSGEGWFVDAEDIPVERLSMRKYMLTQ